jgi:hypothetical protein
MSVARNKFGRGQMPCDGIITRTITSPEGGIRIGVSLCEEHFNITYNQMSANMLCLHLTKELRDVIKKYTEKG